MNVNFEKIIIHLDFEGDKKAKITKKERTLMCNDIADTLAELGMICPVSFQCTVNGGEPNPKDYLN